MMDTRPTMLARPLEDALRESHGRDVRQGFWWLLGSLLAVSVLGYSGVLTPHRYADAGRTIGTLALDAVPPDFSRWRSWLWPILDTLSMSVSGTLLSIGAAVPLGLLAARNVSPPWVTTPLGLLFRVLRAVPCLVWGIVFVLPSASARCQGSLRWLPTRLGWLASFARRWLNTSIRRPGMRFGARGYPLLGCCASAYGADPTSGRGRVGVPV